ncbi:MAG: hypothetical protein ACTSRS_18540 [Candidatus Helarchaeota archaeon]
MRGLVHVLRGFSIMVFILTLYWLLSIIIFQPWHPTTPGTLPPLSYPFTIGDPEINIWNAWVYFFMFSFGILGHLFTGGMGPFPYDWNYFWNNYTVAIYYFGFEVCIIVAVIFMILFLRKCNPEWSFSAFLFLIGMLILVTLSQYAHYLTDLSHMGIAELRVAWILLSTLFGILLFKKAITNLFKKNSRAVFYFCFAAFIITVSYTSQGLLDSIPSFYFDSLSNSVVNLDFLSFVSNPIFLAAFFTFLFLEITYLTAYNYEVSKPSLEREQIIHTQLQTLAQLGERSTEELQAKAELHSVSIRRFFSSEAFDFMREIIERGVYDKEAQARMASMRDYQHLQTYLEDLYTKDPEAKSSLTARAALPDANKLAKASIIGISYRVLLVFVFVIICFSPLYFFNLLAIIPTPITNYLEIRTIAAVLVLAVPLVLLFPFIGTIIKLRRLPKIPESPPPTTPTKQLVASRTGTA